MNLWRDGFKTCSLNVLMDSEFGLLQCRNPVDASNASRFFRLWLLVDPYDYGWLWPLHRITTHPMPMCLPIAMCAVRVSVICWYFFNAISVPKTITVVARKIWSSRNSGRLNQIFCINKLWKNTFKLLQSWANNMYQNQNSNVTWIFFEKNDIQTTNDMHTTDSIPQSLLHSQPLPKIHQRQHHNNRLLHGLLGLGAFSLGLRPSLRERNPSVQSMLRATGWAKCRQVSLWPWLLRYSKMEMKKFTSHKSRYFLKEVDWKPRRTRAQSASATGCFDCSDGELYVSLNLWSGNPVPVSSPLRWPGF